MKLSTEVIYFFLLSLAVAVLHLFYMNFGFYWTMPWVDSSVHFLGGMWVAFIFHIIFVIYFSGKSTGNIRLSIYSVILVGLLWEAFEVFIGTADFYSHSYPIDFLSDMTFDFLGGVCFYLLVRK